MSYIIIALESFTSVCLIASYTYSLPIIYFIIGTVSGT